jgi:hypothetical protein
MGVTDVTKCPFFGPYVPFLWAVYPQRPPRAVDENNRKNFCVHKVKATFPQVSALSGG